VTGREDLKAEGAELAYPLDGLRVISMAEQYPGPYATLILADLGADVILVERPRGGDPSRQFAPFFEALNRNKRSVAADLKSLEGRAFVERLISRSDVFLEGFRPGTAKRLGLGYDALMEINPRLVYASISGYGQDGPCRDRTGHDISYQGTAGMLFRQAREGRPDRVPDVAAGDLSSGMFAVIGVLTALLARQQTGKGTYVDVSMTDGLVSWMTTYLAPTLNGTAPAAIGDEPAYGVFRCGDGKLLSLSIAHEDWFWRPFCETAGLADLKDLRSSERIARSREIRERIAAALSARTREQWLTNFDAAGVPAGPIHDLPEVIQDPQLRSRGLFVQVTGTEGTRPAWHVRQPLRLRGFACEPTRPAPELGEHTREVLLELGYSEEQVRSLFACGAAGPIR
jgi:crotonobetainyl-CoA:carnitine CoA-transferase CaiB-like acyl-CoA transferase